VTVYELRVWPIPFTDASRPLRVEEFEADSNTEAISRMRRFTWDLPRHEQVFLFARGGGRSIASEDGLK
jgi:hypothetical protein